MSLRWQQEAVMQKHWIKGQLLGERQQRVRAKWQQKQQQVHRGRYRYYQWVHKWQGQRWRVMSS
jgi:hypothetical protein